MNLLTKEHPQKTELSTILEQEDFQVLQPHTNKFPKGLVPLEELFDFNDVSKKPKLEPTETKIEECNIGNKEKPKMIKLSKTLPTHVNLKYLELFREFTDVFSLSYEYLKSYDTEII